jgi:hypothetical protein
MSTILRSLTAALVCLATLPAIATTERWSEQQATDWYAKQPWLVGCNFLPSTAINQLEMWQANTFDPETIDRELSWAESIGMNTVRVFLHDICWQDDRDGFFERINKFLDIAAKHNIRPMLVIFDGVWDPHPKSGQQRQPTPGVHNSGWVQSPGRDILGDEAKVAKLEAYVTDVIKTFGQDDRVLAWDLFNEPDNGNANSYGKVEFPVEEKDNVAARLVKLSFDWARKADPSQPLTVGLWRGPAWTEIDKLNEVHKAALDLSDVISFHDYGNPDSMNSRIAQLKTFNRPLICTEFMARGNGSTFEAILPILKQEKVGAYCWGLVDGKSNTKYPWSTWQKPIAGDPSPWHHDIFRPDGTPYSEDEVKLIRELTGVEDSH